MNLDDLKDLGKRTLQFFESAIKNARVHVTGYGPGTRPLGRTEKIALYRKKLQEFPPEPLVIDFAKLAESAGLAGMTQRDIDKRLAHWPPIRWIDGQTILESPWVTMKRFEEGGPQMLDEIREAMEQMVIGEAV